MTDDLQRAVDAARRIVADEECYPHAVGSEGWRTGLIARALLSIISTRDDVIEECAKVAQDFGVVMGRMSTVPNARAAHNFSCAAAAAEDVTKRIRSLKSSTSL